MGGPSLYSGSDFGVDTLSVFCLDSQRHRCIDVEIYPLKKTVRVVGVDELLSCSDFAIRVCRLLTLKPSRYTLKVLDLSNPPHAIWRRPPLCSKLKFWIDNVPPDHQTPVFRLLSKTYLDPSSGSEISSPRWTAGSNINDQRVLRGPDLLEKLGTRIIVHLPGRRKMVVRAHTDHPVLNAVHEVCRKRRLTSGCYFLCNPRNGIPIDPSASFCAQGLSELELRACSVENSDLETLADSLIMVNSTNTGIYHVESFVSNRRSKSAIGSRSVSPDAFGSQNTTGSVLRSHSVGPSTSPQYDVVEQRSDASSMSSVHTMCRRTGTRVVPLGHKKRRAPLPPMFKQNSPSCSTMSRSSYLLEASSTEGVRAHDCSINAAPTGRPEGSVSQGSCSSPPRTSSSIMDLHFESVQRADTATQVHCGEDKSAIRSHSQASYTVERDIVGECEKLSPTSGGNPNHSPRRSQANDAALILKSVTRNGRSCVRRATYSNDTDRAPTISVAVKSHSGPPVPPRPSLEILSQHPKYYTLTLLLPKSASNLDFNETPRGGSTYNTSQSVASSNDESSTSTLSINLPSSVM